MKLSQFTKAHVETLNSFKEMYQRGMSEEPEKWPETMSRLEWEEQFEAFGGLETMVDETDVEDEEDDEPVGG